jgi:hypothetical protein
MTEAYLIVFCSDHFDARPKSRFRRNPGLEKLGRYGFGCRSSSGKTAIGSVTDIPVIGVASDEESVLDSPKAAS